MEEGVEVVSQSLSRSEIYGHKTRLEMRDQNAITRFFPTSSGSQKGVYQRLSAKIAGTVKKDGLHTHNVRSAGQKLLISCIIAGRLFFSFVIKKTARYYYPPLLY